MRKIILLILMSLATAKVHAQTGMLMNRYYITGSLAVGKGERSFADTSAWLQIGKDTTKKGFILPRVVLDSIKTSVRGVFVYDLKDSVLYHFDSNKRVRYMTYRDTLLIKQLIAANVPPIDTNVLATKNHVQNNYVKIGGNTVGSDISMGTNVNKSVVIETNNTSRITVAANGSVGIGIVPSVGLLHVNGAIAADAINYTTNTTIGSLPGTFKDANSGLTDVGANGSTNDYTLINNPTNAQAVFSVPHATTTTHFNGLVEVKKSSAEVQLDLSGSPSGHLYAGVSTGTLDASNRGFLSFGNSFGSGNSALVFGAGKISVANSNLLLGTYTDNGADKLQVSGTAVSEGLKLNNITTPNPAHYNIIKRYNDGTRDGIEILCGGASGGYSGAFKVRSRAFNAVTNPVESFVIQGNIISMGHHGADVSGNLMFNSDFAQVNIAKDNTDGQLLNLWNRRGGHPCIMTFSNYYYGAGGPSLNASIVSEPGFTGYDGILSLFTNNGQGGDYSRNIRALFIDGAQNVAIGLSRSLPPTLNSTGIVLPSARLHVLGSNAATTVNIIQAAASQTADLTQWQNNSGTVLSKIDKDGNATVQKLKTAQPSVNGAGEIKIGKVITGASVTLQTNQFLEVDVDGTIYKLAIVQ